MQFAETAEASHYPTLSQLIQVSKQKKQVIQRHILRI